MESREKVAERTIHRSLNVISFYYDMLMESRDLMKELEGKVWQKSEIKDDSESGEEFVCKKKKKNRQHRQHQSIAKAMRYGVYQLYFHPNCSHWIQPLDDLLFASLQMTIRTLCQKSQNLLCWHSDGGCARCVSFCGESFF